MVTELIKVSVSYLKDNIKDIQMDVVRDLYFEAARCMMMNTSDQALMQCSKVHTFFENYWKNGDINNLNAIFYIFECKCLNFKISSEVFKSVNFINLN